MFGRVLKTLLYLIDTNDPIIWTLVNTFAVQINSSLTNVPLT